MPAPWQVTHAHPPGPVLTAWHSASPWSVSTPFTWSALKEEARAVNEVKIQPQAPKSLGSCKRGRHKRLSEEQIKTVPLSKTERCFYHRHRHEREALDYVPAGCQHTSNTALVWKKLKNTANLNCKSRLIVI